MVNVITTDTIRYGYAATIQGIEEAARAASLVVAITVTGDSDDEVRAAVDRAMEHSPAGIVVLAFDPAGANALALVPAHVPTSAITTSRSDLAVPRVLFDERQGGWDATNYLLGLGHKTVHHVSVPSSGPESGRLAGWRAALQSAGAPVPTVLEADWSARSGYRCGMHLAGLQGVTAVLCGNDEVAFGVVRALQEAGRRVPDDISIVGFDDHPLAEFCTPPLTTMAQDFNQLGRTAVLRLVEQLEETVSQELSLAIAAREARTVTEAAPRLVVRASTAPPAPSPLPESKRARTQRA